MKQATLAARVEMRQVIGTLCGLLKAAGLEAVPPPETFRRAKFGGGLDVQGQLLQLLMEMLLRSGTVSSGDHMEGELRNQVAAGLWQTGYCVDWAYEGTGAEGQAGERSTSRDLLLALGWLIAAGTLEKLLTERVRRVDTTLLTPTRASLGPSGEVQLEPASLRKLQWLAGRLRYQGWTLLSMQEERARLLHAVLLALLPSSASSSVLKPPLVKEDCVCVQQLCELLQTYLSWKEAEALFWTWMDSVLDSRLAGSRGKKVARAPDGIGACCHGKQGLESLEEMLSALPRVQTQETSREKPEHRKQALKAPMNKEGATFLPPVLFPLAQGPSVLQVYRPRLETANCSKRAGEDSSGAPDELPARDARRLLRQTEALLWDRRQRRRLASRKHIQDLVDSLDGLVVVPP